MGVRFEVSSSEDSTFEAATVHCSGAAVMGVQWHRVDAASLRCVSCAADVPALYNIFDATGLQYGPGYRTLVNAWRGKTHALARLRICSMPKGAVQVHPADLDDALCTSALIASSGSSDETRLPFAVDDALLQGAAGRLWAVSL